MDVIFTNNPLQNLYVQHVAGLSQQFPITQLDIARQHMVAILSTPH